MPSSYSSNLKIELQATGENSGTWGTITNTNLGTALEQAIIGYGNPSYASDANLTLTYTDTNAAQAARALVLNVTSAVSLTQTRELVVPTIQKQYIVQNNTTGSQSITVKTSGGTGITVPNGRKAHLYVNGTNVIYMDDFVDINGGAIDGTPIGANSASTGSFTTLGATTGNITTVNATTVDTTNIEVTNLKAKDGTAAGSIADSTGVVTLGSSVLTTTDINGGTIDGTTIGGSSAAAGTFTTLTTSSTVTLNGGTANGVLYLNASKAATSGSALTYDGTTFTSGAHTLSTGVLTVPAGAVGTPSITTTGDTNTGIFFPAADTIAFAEGGVEAMRIDSSGNVGINTTDANPLSNGGTHKTLAVSGGSGYGAISLASTATADGSIVGALGFGTSGASTNKTCAAINAYLDGSAATNASGYLTFFTRTGATIPERMRITSAGDVGIGTSSPSVRLTVGGQFLVSSAVASGPTARIVGQNGTGDILYLGDASRTTGDDSSNAIRVDGTGGATNIFNVKLGGNVGIGTSSPGGRLEVSKSGPCTIYNKETSSSVTSKWVSSDGSQVQFGCESNHPLLFITNNTERARITSGGVLCVNATAAVGNARQFLQTDISAENGLSIKTTVNSGDYGYIRFLNAADQNIGGVFQATSTTLNYATSSDRRLKENVSPADEAGELIDAIQIVKHDWKVGGHTRFGVIAQDLHEVAPEAVTVGDDDDVEQPENPWGVDYSKLVPMLVKEIQSLRARVAQLESK